MKYTKNDHIYKMTKRTLARLKILRGGKVICASSNCNSAIKVNQLVISRINQHRRKVYHKICYDRLFTDL